ncbi:glycoside hydrolase family 61 protein [Phlebiopsis gigantea 11061_1 CR5-6]|uniref:lytic cellulose monooxygenase (C4-dehydrogenating) n=1 Tax=Phlebiopsis gigantea (strain 11061_1 CR5-6) TaxID=745531 RepID=A0A0C3SAG2_PHLG1|nr:glycoside hydrolase family 61 protein [Phlebiopsis gigantea 11061_1 CR5-6]
MKTLLCSVLLATCLRAALAHYTFPNFIANGTVTTDWEYVRITANHYSNGPVSRLPHPSPAATHRSARTQLTDVTDPEFRCYELDLVNTAGATGTATVLAGSTVGFMADNTMGHPGYFDAYMTAAAPAADSEAAGTGSTWFKVWEWAPRWTAATGLIFDSENINQVNFTIPKNLPSGQYLIRLEQIALHVAETYQGAQFYIGCAQVNVVGGGSGTPGPTVAIPGVYTGYEPGILINIYDLPSNYTGYQAPGPAVWSG